MLPTLWFTTPWKAFWLLGAVVGTATNVAVLRARGIPPARTAVVLALAGAGAFLGARLEWMLENGVPLADVFAVPGARMPGGMLALAACLPLLFRAARLPVRRCLDGVTPGAAVAIAVGRIGCFLQGCCFGLPTALPWGVRFPPGSPAYESHRILGWIPPDAAASLPVHPLELYFAAAALVALVVVTRLSPRARWDGEVALAFLAVHAWSKFGLEHLRGREFGAAPNAAVDVEIWIALAATAALAAVALVRRRRAHDAARCDPALAAGAVIAGGGR